MSLSTELKRKIKNFIGHLSGYEKCVFCGDRQNWKAWMANISLCTYDNERVKNNVYKPPVCIECLTSQKKEDVQHAVNADISKYNNFCRCFGTEAYYSDAEKEQIMNQITQAKNNVV